MRTNILREVTLEIEDLQDGFICTNCVKDKILNARAAEFERPRKCSGCGEEIEGGHTPESIADIIRRVLPLHFSVDFGRYEGYDQTLGKIVGRTILSENSTVCDLVGGHLIDRETDDDSEFYFVGQMV